MVAVTTNPKTLADEIAASNALTRARMLVRAEQARKAIEKHGDPGGHLDRYARILETAGGAA